MATGANVGGRMTNCPASLATTSPMVLPSSLRATCAPGAARPATTASPVGSTRTTSKAGVDAGVGAAAAVGGLAGLGWAVAAAAGDWAAGVGAKVAVTTEAGGAPRGWTTRNQ